MLVIDVKVFFENDRARDNFIEDVMNNISYDVILSNDLWVELFSDVKYIDYILTATSADMEIGFTVNNDFYEYSRHNKVSKLYKNGVAVKSIEIA